MRAGNRVDFLQRLRDKTSTGRAIVGAETGCGLSAKCLALGGIDFLVISHGGRLRMAGAGTLGGVYAFGDAIQWVSMMAGHVIPVAGETPVFAGLSAGVPFAQMESLLDDLKKLGFCGVMNNPSVGNWYEDAQCNMERQNLGYPTEIEMIRAGRQCGMPGIASCWTDKQAFEMARAGADIIVVEIGLTKGGMIGASHWISVSEAAKRIQEIADRLRMEYPDVIVLCHGGPLDSCETVREVLERAPGVDGFYGASALERIPIEKAITQNTATLKQFRWIV